MAYQKCKHMASNGVPRKNNFYRCTIEVKLPALPSSVTKEFSFVWPPHRTRIDKDACAECPLFEVDKSSV